MVSKQEVLETIFDAIDELNEQLPKEEALEKSTDTVLFGDSGKLDSLGLVNLFVGMELKIEEKFGSAIALYQRVMSQEMIPFRNIGILCEYIQKILEEEIKR